MLDPNRWPGATILYSLVAGVVCFWRLGATGLVSMEGMVVDGARHMLASGDWLVPRVYGELYTYKPAFAYWLAAVPLRLAEAPSETMLRFPFAAAGFLMGLAILFLVGRVAGRRAGLLAAVASVTGVIFLQKARMMEFDASLAAGVGVAAVAACRNLAARRQSPGVWLLGYLGLAVGFLTKGIPALMIFGPGLLAAALATGRLRRLFRWPHLAAALVFVAIAGSYLWGVWRTAGPAAFEQPVVEAGVRGLGRLSEEDLAALPEARRFSGAEDGIPQTGLGRLGVALAKPVLIWAVSLPWAVLFFFAFRRRGVGDPDVGDRLVRAAAGFLAAGALMFMLVPTYETRYFLPLTAPMAVLCGVTADRLLASNRDLPRRLLGASLAVTTVVAAGTVAMAFYYSTQPIPQANRVTLAAAGTLALLATAWIARRRGAWRVPALLGTAALCVMLTQYLGVEPYRAGSRDLGPQARVLAPHLPAGEPVWVPGPSDETGKHASLYYYLDRPVRTFRPELALPPAGAYCLFTSQVLESLHAADGFRFREVARAENARWAFRLGVCSEAGRGPGAG